MRKLRWGVLCVMFSACQAADIQPKNGTWNMQFTNIQRSGSCLHLADIHEDPIKQYEQLALSTFADEHVEMITIATALVAEGIYNQEMFWASMERTETVEAPWLSPKKYIPIQYFADIEGEMLTNDQLLGRLSIHELHYSDGIAVESCQVQADISGVWMDDSGV